MTTMLMIMILNSILQILILLQRGIKTSMLMIMILYSILQILILLQMGIMTTLLLILGRTITNSIVRILLMVTLIKRLKKTFC